MGFFFFSFLFLVGRYETKVGKGHNRAGFENHDKEF